MSICSKEQADAFIVGLVVAQFKFTDQLLTSTSYNAVYEQFFKILEKTKSRACREVIISNFRDLDEFKQDDAVKRLLSIYEDQIELLTPFIETFTEMCISEETKVRVSSLVQHLLENNCDAALYPSIVKYLLHYVQAPDTIAESLRQNFKWKKNKNTFWEDLKQNVFVLLEKSVRRENSKIAETWIKVVSSLEDPKDMKAIDFVMLLMIVSIKEEKLLVIKKIFLLKLPQGFFTSEFLLKCFETFPSIIAQYSEPLLELLTALQKTNIYEVTEFSSTCFKELFLVDSSDKKEIVGSLVQFLTQKTAQTPFAPKNDFKMVTLNILDEIKKDKTSAASLLINHKILLRVLDSSKVKLTFNEHRMMMELLCALAYAMNYKDNHNNLEAQRLEEERLVLQEHLEMLSNKLMSHPDQKIKQLGVIGAIKIVSAMVINVVANSEELENQKLGIDDLPDGPIRKAATRVELILRSVHDNPFGFAMICDEMILEFQRKGGENFVINGMFLAWLSELMIAKLIETVGVAITEELPEIEGDKLVHKFTVASNDFTQSQPEHSVKLGLMTFVEDSEKVVFLAPLFKITRLLMMHRYSSLKEMYIYSVMPITVTESFATPEDEISNDSTRAKHQLDLYFHSINWLREIVGTYCHFNEEDREALSKCVIQRVKQLVEIEHHLSRLLVDAPYNYYPPPATFLDLETSKKVFDSLRKEKKATAIKPPKKKSKKNDTTAVDTTVQPQVDISGGGNKIRQFCREIDSNFILLLNSEFKFSSTGIGSREFGLGELFFILDDVFSKVKESVGSDSSGFSDPILTIRQFNESGSLACIVKIFNEICGELVVLSQKAEEEDSNEVFFTPDAAILKNCFCLILQLMDVLFTSPRLKMDRNRKLLLAVLKSLLPADVENIDQTSKNDVCKAIIKHCIDFERNVKTCESAVALVRFLTTISKFSTDEHQGMVFDLCESFLKREWKNAVGEGEQGAVFNANLEKLLEIYVEDANLQKLERFTNVMTEDFKPVIQKQLCHLENFPSFNKSNSVCMMRAYLRRLSKILSTNDVNSLDYDFWISVIAILSHMSDIVKCLKSQVAEITYIKNFLVFLRVFNIRGMQVLKDTTKNKDGFLKLVKNAQLVIRFTHGLSCDLKV